MKKLIDLVLEKNYYTSFSNAIYSAGRYYNKSDRNKYAQDALKLIKEEINDTLKKLQSDEQLLFRAC
jgi:hypothetical protein